MRITVKEAKKRRLLTNEHAKVIKRSYLSLTDASIHNLHEYLNMFLTFEHIDNWIIKQMQIEDPYVIIPDYVCESIIIIIFKEFENWSEVHKVAERFNIIQQNIRPKIFIETADIEYSYTPDQKEFAMQIFTLE